MEINKIHQGDWIELAKQLPDEYIDLIMTSPPYWGLRDYGVDGQVGLEDHPQQFIQKIVDGLEILKKKLKKSGSLYLNLGDTYFGNVGHSDWSCDKEKYGRERMYNTDDFNFKKTAHRGEKSAWLQPKQLMLIPSRVAIALQEAGWILRNDIIWHKINPMPSPVEDRLNTTYEHLFHFVKSRKYYYNLDCIREAHQTFENRPAGIVRNRIFKYDSKFNNNPEAYNSPRARPFRKRDIIDDMDVNRVMSAPEPGEPNAYNPLGKNPGDFIDIATQPFPASHFATYPEELCIRPIKSSCPEGGLVLDPFSGSCTTCVVAKSLNRNWIAFELNPEYIKIAEMRLKGCQGWQYKESAHPEQKILIT